MYEWYTWFRVLSSICDVLVRGVGGVCDMCMCLARGGVGGEGNEWMRELGLGFTNPVGSSASHPAGPHGRHDQNGKSGPHCWGRGGST